MIDIGFSDNPNVRAAWKPYHEALCIQNLNKEEQIGFLKNQLTVEASPDPFEQYLDIGYTIFQSLFELPHLTKTNLQVRHLRLGFVLV